MNRIKDEYERGCCPDCKHDIPPDAVSGDNCAQCGFVFVSSDGSDVDLDNDIDEFLDDEDFDFSRIDFFGEDE